MPIQFSPGKSKQSQNKESPFEERSIESVISKLQRLGFYSAPIDLFEVYEFFDLDCSIEPIDNEISGYLNKDSNGEWRAVINALHSENRQRFTMAHELGHFLLHKDSSSRDCFEDKVFFRKSEDLGTPEGFIVEEVEANRFAASLLMPEDEFVQFIRQGNKKVVDVANHFKVSPVAVRIRADNLRK